MICIRKGSVIETGGRADAAAAGKSAVAECEPEMGDGSVPENISSTESEKADSAVLGKACPGAGRKGGSTGYGKTGSTAAIKGGAAVSGNTDRAALERNDRATLEKIDRAALEKINSFSRRKLTFDEVYTFKVRLCDNEADRDNEAFTLSTLEELKDMFIGKTGIFDHDAKAGNQLARIYETRVEYDGERKTSLGEPYACLTASAYIPRTKENEELIEKIDTGILKEVSVSCAVKRILCAECGKEAGECGHDGAVRRLDGAADAYEFSFVAVPAQRDAGVMKSFLRGGDEEMETEKENVVLTKSEHERLEKLAEIGKEYRKSLRAEIRKNACIFQEAIPGRLIDLMTERLGFEELKELDAAYRKLAGEKLPIYGECTLQTGPEKGSGSEYRI